MSRFWSVLGAPFRWLRGLFPLSPDGRQSLVYLIFAGAGPVLTLLIRWAMGRAAAAQQWDIFKMLADRVSIALLSITLGLLVFVGVRAIRIGPEGIDLNGEPSGGADPSRVTTTTTTEVKP
ncbi:MAG TPA: hypothetical protein VFW19_10550 [Allosphingosinicella sp.]|nr:hypothetical protein [Allosphingosinicella sp.]